MLSSGLILLDLLDKLELEEIEEEAEMLGAGGSLGRYLVTLEGRGEDHGFLKESLSGVLVSLMLSHAS